MGGLLSRLGVKRGEGGDAPGVEVALVDRGPVLPTKALKKFLAYLTSQPSPVVLDLGSVIGSNVTFLGEQLGCKIYVEDIYADLEGHLREQRLDAFPSFLQKRLPQPDESVDGILCWDLIDYLDRPAAQVLATELTRLLRVDGALLGFFGTVPQQEAMRAYYTKFVMVDEVSLQHRTYAASRGRQRVLANRDIIRLFEGLRVSDSFLLQTNTREILFRKPSYLSRAKAG
jgi:hypothetical protein